MPKKKNPNPENNVTEKLIIRMTKKDLMHLDHVIELEDCKNRSELGRKIILPYIRQRVLGG